MWFLRLLLNLRQTIRTSDTPKQLAFGLVLGVWLGLTPKDNLFAASLGVLLLATNVNLGIAMFAAFAVSILGGFADSTSLWIGRSLLLFAPLEPFWRRLESWEVVRVWAQFNRPAVLGSFSLGAIAAYPLYRLSLPMFANYWPRVNENAQDASADSTASPPAESESGTADPNAHSQSGTDSKDPHLEQQQATEDRHLAAEPDNTEKIEAERIAAEKIAAEKIAAEKIAAEKIQAERVEAERAEAERLEALALQAARVVGQRSRFDRARAADAAAPPTQLILGIQNPSSDEDGAIDDGLRDDDAPDESDQTLPLRIGSAHRSPSSNGQLSSTVVSADLLSSREREDEVAEGRSELSISASKTQEEAIDQTATQVDPASDSSDVESSDEIEHDESVRFELPVEASEASTTFESVEAPHLLSLEEESPETSEAEVDVSHLEPQDAETQDAETQDAETQDAESQRTEFENQDDETSELVPFETVVVESAFSLSEKALPSEPETSHGEVDSGQVDSGQVDSGQAESESQEPETEVESLETESLETESLETESLETESLETESLETESLETESLETESLQTESVETQSPQAEVAETMDPETSQAEADEADRPREYQPLVIPSFRIRWNKERDDSAA